jgi:hypothetical protein
MMRMVFNPRKELEIEFLKQDGVLSIILFHFLPRLFVALHATNPKPKHDSIFQLSSDLSCLGDVNEFVGWKLKVVAGDLFKVNLLVR